MKKAYILLVMVLAMIACTVNESSDQPEIPASGPIQLHPENQHYFLYKGNALALITSAEHYGALLNLDFDYHTYLR